VKLTIERAPLLKALNHLQSVVERRLTIPILGNVLMKADGGTLSLSTTDMDIELVEILSAQVADPGTITAPVRTLFDIARKLREGAQIELSVEKGALSLYCGRSHFSMPILPHQDYPIMSAGEQPNNFKMPAADLRRLIDCTRFAISTEETRYYLNGIYLHATEDAAHGEGFHLRAVATNGHQLARVDVALPEGAAGMPGVIVPRKTVIELRKLIDGDGDVEVAVGERKIRFSVAAASLTSKLIDGTFPEYGRVIPTGNDKVLEIIRADFTAAIDRVSTISTDRTRAVKMALGEGALTVEASSPENGNAVEDLDARYSAEPFTVGFNSRYLLDIAGQIEGDGLQFAFADAGAPALIRDAADASALYVIMPMRV
jgi:DNA polymerase-3 subunit beta